MARVGGVVFPKQLQQFEAWHTTTAPTASPTRRTISSSAWSTRRGRIEEYTATFDDDDMQVRRRDRRQTGLFTPNVDGPNPQAQRQPQQHRRRLGRRRAARRPAPATGEAAPGARAPARDGAALHALVRSDGGHAMTSSRCASIIAFEAAGQPFLYLVPSAAVFALDDARRRDPRRARPSGPRPRDELSRELSAPLRRRAEVGDTIAELARVRAIGESSAQPAPTPKILPLKPLPLTDDGAQRHQPVQPGLHLLLRVRRGQDRRHRERQAAEVHERGDGARERRVRAARSRATTRSRTSRSSAARR